MVKIGLREIFLSSGTVKLKAIKLCDYIFGSLIARLIKALPCKKGMPNPSRILVIRPGGLGDAIFLLPVFKAIKSKYPQASISVLCQKRNSSVFLSQPHLVDHIYDSFKDLIKIFRNNYDIIVDTEQWHYFSALTAYLCKAPIKIGFATRILRYKFFNITVNYDNDAYELENFKSLFENLIKEPDQIRYIDDSFLIPENIKAWAKDQIPSNSVAISIAASVPERCLSEAQLLDLSRGVLRRGFCPVFLGGRDCATQSNKIMKQLNSSQAYNFVGKISLQQSAALIKTSHIFIGTDSGLMHLACAIPHPVITFFGAGNMKKWMQTKEGRISINKNVPCSPCTSFGYGLPVCGGSVSCLREIDLNSILDQYLKSEND